VTFNLENQANENGKALTPIEELFKEDLSPSPLP
jgi:hypothetical protein